VTQGLQVKSCGWATSPQGNCESINTALRRNKVHIVHRVRKYRTEPKFQYYIRYSVFGIFRHCKYLSMSVYQISPYRFGFSDPWLLCATIDLVLWNLTNDLLYNDQRHPSNTAVKNSKKILGHYQTEIGIFRNSWNYYTLYVRICRRTWKKLCWWISYVSVGE